MSTQRLRIFLELALLCTRVARLQNYESAIAKIPLKHIYSILQADVRKVSYLSLNSAKPKV